MTFSKLKLDDGFTNLDDQRYWLIYYLFSLLAGLYAFLVILAVFLPDGIVEQEEMLVFVLGWPAASLAVIFSVPLLRFIQQRYFQEMEEPLWVLLVFNALLFVLVVTGLNLFWQPVQSSSVMVFFVNCAIFAIPLANVLLIWMLINRKLSFPIVFSQKMLLLSGFGFLYFVSRFSLPIPPVWVVFTLLGSTALVYININSLKNSLSNRRFLIICLDIVVFLLILLACFDPAFSIDLVHQNFYLGPVNRILHGGTMLVDTFSQYGVLVIYFIGLIFKTKIFPFTYQGLSFMVAVLFMLHFIMLYLLLIAMFKDRFYAIFLLGLTVLLGFFGTMGQIQAYPSVGPLRFELAYLILFLVFLRKRFPIFQRYGLLVEYILLGIASLWSFESFTYTAFPYMGICVYESLNQPTGWRQALKNLLLRLLYFILTLVAFQLVFMFFTFSRSGIWPDWATYLGFIKSYSSVGGFGTLLIYAWSDWFLMVLIYFASIAAFLFQFFFQKEKDNSPESVFIFGLTLTGIAFFTYFLGRSHPNNLYHISTPAVIIAGYGIFNLRKSNAFPEIFRSALNHIFYSAAIIIILVQTPVFLGKTQQRHSGFNYQFVLESISSILPGKDSHLVKSEQNILHQGSGEKQVTPAVKLIKKYTPTQKYATVFLSPTNSTEVLMRSGRLQRFPINDVLADSVSNKLFLDIINFPQVLKVNDFIFLLNDPLLYTRFDNKVAVFMIDRLCHEFHFREVENSPAGVSVIKLQPPTKVPTAYCEAIRSIKNSYPQ